MGRIAKYIWKMRWARIGAGCALVVCSLLLGIIPFLPGFLVGIPGLAILAREFPWLKKCAAPFERVFTRLKRLVSKMRQVDFSCLL